MYYTRSNACVNESVVIYKGKIKLHTEEMETWEQRPKTKIDELIMKLPVAVVDHSTWSIRYDGKPAGTLRH